MVKMSENSRHLAALLIERIPAYFPPEKLQFFDETGGVGIEFSKLPFDHLLFTGSGTTGRAVMAAAAQNLCPVTLELGGKAPAIVCDDFDLRTAAERILFTKYLNAGQICTTVDHAYVPRAKVAGLREARARDRAPALPEPGLAGLHLDHRPARLRSAGAGARRCARARRHRDPAARRPGPGRGHGTASRRTSSSTRRPTAR